METGISWLKRFCPGGLHSAAISRDLSQEQESLWSYCRVSSLPAYSCTIGELNAWVRSGLDPPLLGEFSDRPPSSARSTRMARDHLLSQTKPPIYEWSLGKQVSFDPARLERAHSGNHESRQFFFRPKQCTSRQIHIQGSRYLPVFLFDQS